MFADDQELAARVRRVLDASSPAVEAELIRLSLLVAELPSSLDGARARHLVVDIDDLASQARWHLGQALAILDRYPELNEEIPDGESPVDFMRRTNLMPSTTILLMRGHIRDADNVVFADLSEPRRGGTAAGWVYHMMIDGAIVRSIAALDRVARLLWYLAELPQVEKSGKPVRVYFRSGKLRRIHSVLKLDASKKLVEIASHQFLEYVTDYRDGLSHEMKAYTHLAGVRPTDHLQADDGRDMWLEGVAWSADSLFGLANGAYNQLRDSLALCLEACSAKWTTPYDGESA